MCECHHDTRHFHRGAQHTDGAVATLYRCLRLEPPGYSLCDGLNGSSNSEKRDELCLIKFSSELILEKVIPHLP